ncbi:MAG: hypothetical protein QM533_10815 [Cytophagales bacterium]|nr:hypothetical protein [Cytophagales bacterium]
MATVIQSQTGLIGEDDENPGTTAAQDSLTWSWKSWPSNLRRAAVLLAVIVVLAIAAIWFLQEQDKDLSQKLSTQNGLKANAEAKLRDSGQERDSIVKHLPILRDLEAKGIFGEEKRLEWVEQLRTIEKRWLGITIKYDIAPQKILFKEGTNVPPPQPTAGAKLPNGDPVKNFSVFSTDMKLTLRLLHEGDVFAIFDELKAANLGLFSVKQCNFKRPSNSEAQRTPDEIVGDGIEADCALTWVSMNAYNP